MGKSQFMVPQLAEPVQQAFLIKKGRHGDSKSTSVSQRIFFHAFEPIELPDDTIPYFVPFLFENQCKEYRIGF